MRPSAGTVYFASSEVLNEGLDAVESLFQFLQRGSVSNTNVLLCTECLARDDSDMRFRKQPLGELHRVVDAFLAEGDADIRIGVECAARIRSRNAGNRTQARDNIIT